MKLLTPAIIAKLPRLYTQETVEDPIVHVKLFNPGGPGTWWVLEFDPEEGRFFGYVTGLQGDELGYFSLQELESFRGRYGLGIERDIHFRPCPLSKVQSGEVR